MAKTRYMIAAGASVVIVRDGKRKTIQAGGGAEFTEDEITRANAAVPGALRKPVNESRAVADEDEGEDGETETKAAEPKAKKAKAKAKPAADAKPDAKAKAEGGGEDADEDEDI